MLSKQALLFQIDNGCLATLVFLLSASFVELHLSLGSIDRKFLLPQSFDLTFVLQFSHSALLRVHLLEALILGKLLAQLLLKLVLHSALFSKSLFL